MQTEFEPVTTLDLQAQGVLVEQLRSALQVSGDVVEIGVWRGGTAKALAEVAPGRFVHLFDTFSGMPEPKSETDIHKVGDFADTSLASVESALKGFRNVKFYPGLFPGTMPVGMPRICFLHLDVDIYQSTKDGLEKFFPLLNVGGIILIDDYGRTSCPGVKVAVDEFAAANQCQIEIVGFRQAAIKKELNSSKLAQGKLDEALALHEQNRFAEADAIYKQLISEYPRWSPALWHYGRMMHVLGYQQKSAMVKAAQLYSAAIKGDGGSQFKAESFSNLGTILLRWGYIKEAKECWRRCLALCPDHPHARVNLGIAHRVDGELLEASAYQRAAILENPYSAEAHFENAFIRLTLGDLVGGFEEYEWRWKCEQFVNPPIETDKPRWEGEHCPGKTIMLWAEQGLGDTIMFCRYTKMVKERSGATVHLQCPPELVRLMRSVEGIDHAFCERAEDDDYFDFQIPLLSLPRIFKTDLGSIPSEPYISRLDFGAVPRWSGPFRIGIAWAGRKEHGGDKWRSTKLEQWTPLFALPGIEWHSLQVGEPSKDWFDPKLGPQRGVAHSLKDFSDTAAVIAGLDLVICVDTAVAHLAGAMGKPVWVLLPFSPDWRWMLEREDSPWYPTIRLFRQPKKGDWSSVFERVKKGLILHIGISD